MNIRIFVGRLLLTLGLISAIYTETARAAEPVTQAVVIMYHRFGEQNYPSTNVTMAQFQAHVEELKTGGYNVISLPEIVDALRQDRALPPKTVGLSVDDAYDSVYESAWPVLKEAGFPLTVFVATDPVDQGTRGYMSWDRIRELRDSGVTIGSQTKSHPHMPTLSIEAAAAEINQSNDRFQAELGNVPDLIAYPYGEVSAKVMDLSKELGFVAGFGQHSGAIGSGGELFYLPRFAMNEAFGSIDRFKLAANALPFGVRDVTPLDPVVGAQNPPNIGFTVTWPTKGLDRINCFASHVGKATIQTLGPRLEVRVEAAMPRGRSRVNCTMPAGEGRWYWFGRQYVVPR